MHNNVVHQTTRKAPFVIVYTKVPRQALDLIELLGGYGASVAAKNMAKQWKSMIDEVIQKIEKSNAKYKAATDKHKRQQVFTVSDQVTVFLRQEQFPMVTFSKLQSKKYGPY